MNGRQWAIMLIGALVSGLGVFVGSDIDLDSLQWVNFAEPRYVLGTAMAVLSSVLSYISKSPRD